MSRESVEVIAERLRGMEERLMEKIELVYEQAKKTNGRVNNIESWKGNIEWKIILITGGLVFVIAINVPKIWDIIKPIL